MSNLKISQLNAGGAAQSGDLLPIDRAGANFSITAASIAALASGTVSSVTGTANQIDVATGTTTPVLSLDAAIVLPGTLTGTNTLALNATNQSGGTGGALLLSNSNAAVLGTNYSSAELYLKGFYWDGSASQLDFYNFQNSVNAGTGAGSKLNLTHSYGNNASAGPILVNLGLIPVQSGSVSALQTTTPAAPTVTPISTGGGGTSTTWSYVIVALDNNGNTTAGGSTGTTAVGSSTLDNSGTQQNNLTWTAISGAASYVIYRTVAGGTPSTTGKIGTSINNAFSDVGTAGDSTTAPTLNVTGSIKVPPTGTITFSGNVRLQAQAGGTLLLDNTAGAWTALQIGGTTSSFPSIQRSGTTVYFRLADSSADAPVKALTFQSTQATGTAPFTVASTTQVTNLNASSLGGATFAAPGAIGSGTASTGAFTTLSASSTVSGTGFSTYLASPPAIGGTAAAAVTGTTVRANTGFSANGTAGVSAGPFTTISSITTVTGIVTALSGSSDARLKDFTSYTGGLAEIELITPVKYRWNSKGQIQTGLSGDQEFIGFIAQNVQEAIPEAITSTEVSKVDGESDVQYLSLDDRPIIAALVNAVRTLSAEIKLLKQRT